jgi:exopolysaccharide biosynthesis polyprenyl glycosylphosphotransferase
LAVSDIAAVVFSFTLAYFLRTHVDARPYYFDSEIWEFVISIILLIPLWILIFLVSGLYQSSIYSYRSKEYGRLLIASITGIMSLISYEFFTDVYIFPVRIVAVIAMVLCFLLLIIFREILKAVRRQFLKHGRGVLNLLIVGNNENTRVLTDTLRGNLLSGYKVVGIVANGGFIPDHAKELQFSSIKAACEKVSPDVIIQTDDSNTDKVFNAAIDQHLRYGLVPSHEVLLSHLGEINLIGSQPVISVGVTPLIGGSRLVKRLGDMIFGSLFLAIASPFMLVIAIVIKINEPHGTVFYREKRLTRFGKKRYIFKFRSMKTTFSGMTPEEAFEKMGKPELIPTYRAGGDQLDDDPRITTVGKFLRKLSLDELPQLLNVVKGDISLVGPRALQPGELAKYPNKNLILSAKSGLTGLAQVSGRRDISFEERRLLDIYYIQNWSLLLDVQIVLRTVLTVLLRRGAR